jgi:predicted SprT family Zn-dependent metalloprotease
MTLDLMRQHGLTDWALQFDNARVRAGICRYSARTIGLSKHFVAANTLERVRTTVLHELAHALVGPGHNHDRVWQAKCLAIGGDGRPRYDVASTVMPEKPWVGRCNCYQIWQRTRLTQRMRTATCAACNKPIRWEHR